MRALSFFVFLGAARRSLKGLKSMLLEGSGGNRIPAGCAISSIFSRSAKCIAGDRIVKSISVMHFFFILLYVSVTSGHINSSYGFSSLYHRRGSFFYVRFLRTCANTIGEAFFSLSVFTGLVHCAPGLSLCNQQPLAAMFLFILTFIVMGTKI